MEVLGEDSFAGVELALFSAGASRSLEFAPHAVEAGALVVDNSSAFRMDEGVPLVVPEVNPAEVFKHQGIIANPNCSTIQMVVALEPLHRKWGLARVIVSTYQAVSGTGRQAIDELDGQVRDMVEGREPRAEVYPHRIAFNCLPHIDVFMDGGYTREEWKMVRETQKIMGLPGLPVTATTVRVPVRVGHSESVYAEFDAEVSVEEAREVLARAPGVVVEDDPETNLYPLAIRAAGTDPTYVGRIRSGHLPAPRPQLLGGLGQPAQGGRAQRRPDRGGLGRRAARGGERPRITPRPTRRRAPPWTPGAGWAPGKSAGGRSAGARAPSFWSWRASSSSTTASPWPWPPSSTWTRWASPSSPTRW